MRIERNYCFTQITYRTPHKDKAQDTEKPQDVFKKIITGGQSQETMLEAIKQIPLADRAALLNQYKSLEERQKAAIIPGGFVPPHVCEKILEFYQNAISLLETSLQ